MRSRGEVGPVKRLLLISNSTQHGSGYLDHCEEEIRDFLGDAEKLGRVAFVPYALADRDGYTKTARERFERMGYELSSVHEVAIPREAVAQAGAVFIGGGNTFRLLQALYEQDLLAAIRARVEHGMPYVGTSAGSNVACPTIRTTNDMPIVEPPSFDALGLVPFQLNPHYLDPQPGSEHMGETREERITQFLEENDRVVVGLREGSMLRIEGDRFELRGPNPARIFRRGGPPCEVPAGERLDDLL
jgi:dipeptidase E